MQPPKKNFSKIFSNRQQQQHIFKLASCMPVSWSYPLPFLTLWNHTKVLITLIIPFFPSFYFGVFFFKTWTWPDSITNPTQTLPELNPNLIQNLTWILLKPDLTQTEPETWPNVDPNPNQTQLELRWFIKPMF